MSFVLSDDEKKSALKQITLLKEIDPIFYEQKDFEATKVLLEGPEFQALLEYKSEAQNLPATKEQLEKLKLKDEEGKEHQIPKSLLPLVEYLHQKGFVKDEDGFISAAREVLDWLLEVIEDFLTKKKTLYSQLEEIINDSDKHYRYFRDTLKEFQLKYDDNTMDIVMLIPDYFVYALRLLADPEIPKQTKIELGIAVVYLVSPIDLIPEALIPHPIAFFDDVTVMIWAIKRSIEGQYITRSDFEKHWPGNPQTIDSIKDWANAIQDVIPEEKIMFIIKTVFNRVRARKA